MQPVQDITVDDRVSRTQYQYTLEDPNVDELRDVGARMLAKLQQLPELRDVASDQQALGLRAQLVIDRDTASRLGITPAFIDQTLYDAFGQRQISTMFTQMNQYHVILELEPQFREHPRSARLFIRSGVATAPSPVHQHGVVSGGLAAARPAIAARHAADVDIAKRMRRRRHDRVRRRPRRVLDGFPNGNQAPLSALVRVEQTTAPITVNHQGQFPVVTLSFNLAPGASLGAAVDAVLQGEGRTVDAGQHPGAVPGSRRGFRELAAQRAAADSRRDRHRLHRPRRAVRELHSSADDSLDTALGRRGRALALLLLTGTDFSIIALIGSCC